MNFLEKLVANSRIYNFFYRRTMVKWFLDFCKLEGKCLEVGCGKGEIGLEILKRFDVELISTDLDRGQVKLAEKTLAETSAKVMYGDATKLPFKDESFDCALEMFVLVHIKDYNKALREIKRVLKKGGSFFIMDQSRYLMWPLSRLLPFDHFDGKFTKKTMIGDLRKEGFEVFDEKWGDIFAIHARKV